MKPVPRPAFVKAYERLPISKRKKFDRLLPLLLENPQYPSLRARKMSGADIYEARLDEHYRFTYEIIDDVIYLRTIGPHDTGLGKK